MYIIFYIYLLLHSVTIMTPLLYIAQSISSLPFFYLVAAIRVR